MRPRRADLLALALLVALASFCFARLVAEPGALLVDAVNASIDFAQRIDTRPVGNDLTFLFLPHYLHVAEQTRRLGHVPQWDDSGFCGRPLVGNPQAGLWYPPVWLALASRSPAALGWLTIAHVLWAGLGCYVMARGIGLGPAAAVVAAGCYQASPYLLAQTFEGHYPHVWAASWYPWACVAYRRLRAGALDGVLGLSLILALMFLTGHPQEWFYFSVCLAVWNVYDLVVAVQSREHATTARLLLGSVAVFGLVLGLAAVEILPDLASGEWGLRSSRQDRGYAGHYLPQPLNIFQLLGPFALGGPAEYFGHDNYWESVFSIGLIPLVLAVTGVGLAKERGQIRGWLALVVGATLFAVGRRVGIFGFLYESLPIFNRFRVPSRSLFLASLGAAMLAGLGVEALRSAAADNDGWNRCFRRFRRVAIYVFVVLIALVCIAPWVGFWQEGTPSMPEVGGIGADLARASLASKRLLTSGLFWGASLTSLALLAMGTRIGRYQPALAVALGLCALVELGGAGCLLMRVVPPERFMGDDPISACLAQAEPRFAGPFRIRTRDTLYHDLRAETHGFEKVNLNDSFQLRHSAKLYQPLYRMFSDLPLVRPTDAMAAPTEDFRRELRQALLDRLGVALLVSDRVEPNPTWPLVACGWWNGSVYAVHRNPSALPRAYVVPRAEVVPSEPGTILSRFRTTDARDVVLMTEDPLPNQGPRQAFTPAEWSGNDPDRVVMRVTTEAPGLLVVGDTWMPGWLATVNGRPAPVLRGNHAQRVVAITDAGPHEIVMRYESPGFRLGGLLSSGTAVLWITIAGVVVGAKALRSATASARARRQPAARERMPLQTTALRSMDAETN